MGKRKRNTPSVKRRSASPRLLALAAAAAVVLVGLFIVVGRMGSSDGPPPTSSTYAYPVSGTSKGSPDAPVTIVEYSDYQCSFCQQFAATTEKQLDKAYIETGKVRFIYKHFIVYGEESIMAAIASELAAEQNKFWPFHDLLMQARASPKKEGDLSKAVLQGMARQVGLDMKAFDAGLQSQKYREKVMKDDAEGRGLRVEGTPSFMLNGKRGLKGFFPFETFQKEIEILLKESAN